MCKFLPGTVLLALSWCFVARHDCFAQLPPLMKHQVIVADEGNGKVHYINLADPAERWTITAANRDLQLVGADRLMVSVGDGYAEYNVKTGAFIGKVTTGGTVQSVFRITQNNTFVGCDGSPASITETDSTGKQIRKINLPVNAGIRIVRPTNAKTFLVGGKIAGVMYECDSAGTIRWEAQVGGEPYMALRLPNGNTLISTGYGAQMALVDKDAKVLKKFPTQTDIGGSDFWTRARPYFFAGFQILENGNVVVANWEGHGGGNGGKGFQLIEIDSGLTKVVSYWKQDSTFVSSLHGVLVLDGLDTRNMYSDVNGIPAPVTPPVAIRCTGEPRYAGYVLPENPAIPAAAACRMFDLDGRLIPRFSDLHVSGMRIRQTNTANELHAVWSR